MKINSACLPLGSKERRVKIASFQEIRMSCDEDVIQEAYGILRCSHYFDHEKLERLQGLGFDLDEIVALALEVEHDYSQCRS